MLLESAFDMNAEARAIKNGCEDAINNGILTPEIVKDTKAYTTSDIGDYIAEYIAKN